MKNAIAKFDQKTFTYTYTNNDWSFTNYFEGDLRISEVGARGTLREKVKIVEYPDEVYVITWEYDEMGPITQVVDFKTNTLCCAIKWEGRMEIWPGVITEFK